MVRYDLPKTITDAMTAVLESHSVYQYWFPSHATFVGQPVTGSRTGTTKTSLSTSSLEILIGTFILSLEILIGTIKFRNLNRYVQNRDTLGDYNSNYSALTLQSAAEYGNSDTTF